jgi:hypothetical protein
MSRYRRSKLSNFRQAVVRSKSSITRVACHTVACPSWKRRRRKVAAPRESMPGAESREIGRFEQNCASCHIFSPPSRHRFIIVWYVRTESSRSFYSSISSSDIFSNPSHSFETLYIYIHKIRNSSRNRNKMQKSLIAIAALAAQAYAQSYTPPTEQTFGALLTPDLTNVRCPRCPQHEALR